MPTEIVVDQVVIMSCCYDSRSKSLCCDLNCIEGVILEGTLMLPFVQPSTVLCCKILFLQDLEPFVCLLPPAIVGHSVSLYAIRICLLHLLCPLMSPSGLLTARH
jgi:hypothetical protein